MTQHNAAGATASLSKVNDRSGVGGDRLEGGSGDDVMISADDNDFDEVEAGDDFDVCLFGAGDELGDCEY